jgi:hypothetical protein
MSRVFFPALIGLSCALLGVFGSARADGPTDEELGAAFGRWKSCVRLIQPGGGSSVADLQGMLERPTSIKQLLKNLKVTWDRDLLIEPSLYNQGVLQKLFDSADVRWRASDISLPSGAGFVVAELNSRVTPGMSVTVESRCWQTDSKTAAGVSRAEATIIGFVHISGGPIPGMTLSVVRDAFGLEAENIIDPGMSAHGYAYNPTYAGSVVYREFGRLDSTGLSVGTTFRFKLRQSQPQPGTEAARKIVDDDVVQDIDVYEAKGRIFGR